jgi:hypothetical protein
MSEFVRPDGVSPGLQGFRSATKRGDGVVVATDSADCAALLAAGYVPLAAMPRDGNYYGAVSFDKKPHSGLIAPVLQGTI